MPRLPRHALVALLVLAALPPRPARSQEDDPEALERRVEELRREEKELAGKLEEVRRLLAEAERAHQLARARVTARAMRARIEELTPRRFEHDVQVGFQTKEEFRRSVLELMEQEYPPEVARGQAAALTALGLVPPGTDLRETLVAAALSQAAAYYDPRKDTFYVVMELPRGQEEAIFLHELQHAMQDQRLGLDETWRAALASGNEDSQQAFRFLAEGEATYLMTVFGARKILGKAGTQAETELIRFFRQRAETPHAVLLREMKARAGVLGGDMAEAFEGARDLPPFVLRSLYDAYYRGAYTVARVKEAKGWAGIDELFRDPPRSTEQMLHPQKLLGPEREEPIEVRLPEQPDGLGEGWMKVHESTFGEASLIILLTEQLPEEEGDNARAAAAGGGGDRYAAYARADALELEYRFDGVAATLEAVRKRLDAAGCREAAVTGAGGAGFVVRIPPALRDRSGDIKRLVGSRGRVEFRRTVEPDHEAYAHYAERFRRESERDAEAARTVTRRELRPRDRKRFPHGLRWYRLSERALRLSETRHRKGWVLCRLDGEDIGGADLQGIQVRKDLSRYDGRWVVTFEVRKLARAAMARLTSAKGENLAVIADDRVETAPVLQSTLSSNGEISGNYSRDEARYLAAVLQSGELRQPPVLVREKTGMEEGAKPLLVWLTVWDTDVDAEEFERAYRRAAAPRNERRGWPAARVRRSAARVAVVEGASAERGAALIRGLLESPAPARDPN